MATSNELLESIIIAAAKLKDCIDENTAEHIELADIDETLWNILDDTEAKEKQT